MVSTMQKTGITAEDGHHNDEQRFRKSSTMRAGEMAMWLRALAALAEDLGSVPSTHIGGSQPRLTPVQEI